MDRRGLTLRQVAEGVGKSTSTAGAWTQAKNWPEVDVQPKLAALLGVPVQWLIHGIPPEMETTEEAEIYTPGVSEAPAVYPTPTTPEAIEARRLFEETFRLATASGARMGWLLEQLRFHLRPPAHWHLYKGQPDDHPAVKEIIDRAHARQDAFRDPQESGKTNTGTSQPKAAS